MEYFITKQRADEIRKFITGKSGFQYDDVPDGAGRIIMKFGYWDKSNVNVVGELTSNTLTIHDYQGLSAKERAEVDEILDECKLQR